jgi:hypothetical protein
LGFDDYNKFLEDLTKNKKVDLEEMKSKMASCGTPGLTGVAVRKFALIIYIVYCLPLLLGIHGVSVWKFRRVQSL